MLTVIVGQTFHGTLAEAPVDKTPQRQRRTSRRRRRLARLLRERVRSPVQGDGADRARALVLDRPRAPVRMYRIDPDGKHKTIRLTYRTGANEYWGVQMTDWEDAPSSRSATSRDRRPALRAPLQRAEAAHGRAAAGRRELLGREHAARLALERDDDRDRQGLQADREAEVGTFRPVSRSLSSAPATSASSPARARSSGTTSSSATSSPTGSSACAPARCRSTSPGSTSC